MNNVITTILATAIGFGTMFAPEEPLNESVYNKMLLCREIAANQMFKETPSMTMYFAGMAAAYQDVYISLMDDEDE